MRSYLQGNSKLLSGITWPIIVRQETKLKFLTEHSKFDFATLDSLHSRCESKRQLRHIVKRFAIKTNVTELHLHIMVSDISLKQSQVTDSVLYQKEAKIPCTSREDFGR